MVRRSSEKLTIDSAFRVPKCDELAGAFQKLRASKVGIYGVTPFTELPHVTLGCSTARAMCHIPNEPVHI